MNCKRLKYLFAVIPFSVWFYFGCATSRPATATTTEDIAMVEKAAAKAGVRDSVSAAAAHEAASVPVSDSTRAAAAPVAEPPAALPDSIPTADSTLKALLQDTAVMRAAALMELEQMMGEYSRRSTESQDSSIVPGTVIPGLLDSLAPQLARLRELGLELPPADTLRPADVDAVMRLTELITKIKSDTAQFAQNLPAPEDTAAVAPLSTHGERKPFLDAPISGTNTDSLVYDVKNNMIYIYNGGDVDYQDLNLKADVVEFEVATKEIYAYGVPIPDSANAVTQPIFTQGGQEYKMDTIKYNLATNKSIIRRTVTQQGEGYMVAEIVKKQPNNDFDMAGGQYTTCNHVDHPHFYISMNKGKVIPNKKVIFGTAYFVLEDVPLYFPFIPFGFFPLATGPSSGFIMPTFGEEYIKGFFIRDGGYYFRFSDYVDAQVTAGIYTLGSWNAKASARYMKRYKYTGNFSFDYAQNVIGEKGAADYINSGTYNLRWSHSQDPKFRPGTTFTASVNISSSGYNKHSTTNMNDYLNTQTNSSIAYTKNWSASGRFPGANLSVSFNHSQNSQDSTVSLSFPNASWSMPKFKPFKRLNASGREKWYEKLSISYSGKMQGSIYTKESDLFTSQTLDNMKFGISHTIPISVSWNILNYINFTPSATYNEQWHFRKIEKRWDAGQGVVLADTTKGFFRTYDYRFSASLSTKIYGIFQMKNQQGWLKAVRHVITPSASFSFAPDFSSAKYGRRLPVQTDQTGTISTYSPYTDLSPYSPSSGGRSASINFSLQQNLEAKIRSDRDTTGMRVIKIIDNLSLSGSYDFLADRKLSTISFNFSTPITKNFPLKFSGTLDPYYVDKNGTRTNEFLVKKTGKLVRLASVNTSFSYSWNKTLGSESAMNDMSSQPIMPTDYEMELMTPEARADAELRRRLMTSTYYDFSIPFNFGFSYTLGYTNNGVQKRINQTLSFNGSVTLTPFKSDGTNRWGINFNAGYDFEKKTLTPGTVSLVRDLHCFTMSVNWVPIGYRRSWSFNIRIKADVLKDLKYDKSSSHYDTLYD